jgi:hypothetical protein
MEDGADMQFIEQKLKHNCGQIAVAALTGASLDRVHELVGHRKSTHAKDLAKALRALGYWCPDRCHASMFGRFGIAQVRGKRKGWHWVAIGDGMVYDGLHSGPMEIERYKRFMEKAYQQRMTSFLPVAEIGQNKP